MTLDSELLGRWHQLLHEYEHCEGYTLRSRLRTFRLSLFTFDRNYENLIDAITAIKPSDNPRDDTVFEFGDRVDPQLFEVCRCLQNLVSAAMTLVDQSRALYNKLYKPDGKVPEYESEIRHRFAENAIHQFVQGLRNMTVHHRLPVVGYTERRQIGIGSSSVDFQVYFQKGDLLQNNRWNAHAESFLNHAPEKIDIAGVMRDYHSLVVEFHRWFSDSQRDAHKEQLEQVESLESQLRQIADEIRRLHKARWPDIPSRTD